MSLFSFRRKCKPFSFVLILAIVCLCHQLMATISAGIAKQRTFETLQTSLVKMTEPHSCEVQQAIDEDLETYRGGITEQQIMDLSLEPDLIEYSIIQNRIYQRLPSHMASKSHHDTGLMLLRILCYHSIPDMKFFVNIQDGQKSDIKNPVPAFSFTKHAYSGDILYPYWSFMLFPNNDDLEILLSSKAEFDLAWSAKKNIAIWRGSTTGGIYDAKNWKLMPRTILVEKCRKSPLCDAGFVDFPQTTPDAREQILHKYGKVERMNRTQLDGYKYQIVLDGNFGAASRVIHVLSSGSLLLLQETEYYEFFYPFLRPFVHYVPVSASLEDLEAKIKWAMMHDKQVGKIVWNALRWVLSHRNRMFVDNYYHKLLMEYSALQRFNVSIGTNATLLGIKDIQHFFHNNVANDCPNKRNIDEWALIR